jgi:predicted DNA-binding transcriptional regulator AlpA
MTGRAGWDSTDMGTIAHHHGPAQRPLRIGPAEAPAEVAAAAARRRAKLARPLPPSRAASNRLIDIREVEIITSLSERTIDELESRGGFPKRVPRERLDVGKRLYVLKSIERWVDKLDPNPPDET